MNRFGIDSTLRTSLALAAALAISAGALAGSEIGATRYATSLRVAPESTATPLTALAKDPRVNIKALC